MRSYVYPIKDAGQKVREVILMHEDITERKRTDDAIRSIAAGVSVQTGEDFFQALVKHLTALFEADYAFVGVLDAHDSNVVNTKAVHAQGSMAENFSYRLEGTPCMNVASQGTCVYPSGVQRQFPDDALLARMGCEGYIGTPLINAQGEPIGLVVVLSRKPLAQTEYMREILEIFAARAGAELQRLQAEEHIREVAYRDRLTGLANRASLHEYLPALLERSRTLALHSAMLLIDLDHFKTINDALSHQTGDLVLREVARRLARIAPGDTFVARLGGDEFVLLMPEISGHAASAELQARQLAEAVVASLEEPVSVGDQQLKVDASIGATLFPQSCADAHDVLRHADIALYRAKSQGRGSIQFFAADMQARVSERLEVESSLRHALANEGLALYMQPQLDKDGRIFGAEALLRCRRPDGSLFMPDSFIPVAEETGLIHPIGQWALASACASLKSWESAVETRDLTLSINVSNWQFVRDDFVAQIERHLAQSGAKASRLTIEITESALFYDVGDAIRKMQALKSMGLRLSLDDFGTGYSSLSYLKKLPLDELKIDRAFIRTASAKTPDVFIESIIAIGHAMGTSIIAEGVETEEQRTALINMGCDGFQGYLWSRPLPVEGFVEHLAAQAGTG
jgi:diguanylate cyclase (GGDEF)-like protein